jgi:tRNA pseudouridine55 synthase
MNRLFVVKKPIGISSNFYLRKIKKTYKNKKAGFSGTLDSFACGCLIVAFGKYTQLFQFLNKVPKTYRTTIWLGATSNSLDNENISKITHHKTYNNQYIEKNLGKLIGDIGYLPPKYSAKKIYGKRAYNLARKGIEFNLKKINSKIYNIKFINYNHPFISFDITVSEGSYIRSIAQEYLKNIDGFGTLSYLERLNEGKFRFDSEKILNPLDYLSLDEIGYNGSKKWFELGKKLQIKYFDNKCDGKYIVVFDTFFSIIEIKNEIIKYILNKISMEYYD